MKNPIELISGAISSGASKEAAEHLIPAAEQAGKDLEDYAAQTIEALLRRILDGYAVTVTVTVQAVKKP